MTVRKAVAILGLVGAVAALAVVGTAMAQTPTPTPNQAKTNYQNLFMDKLAAALGITRDNLNKAFTQARNDTADQAVKDGNLTQQQADKIKSNPNVGVGPGFGFGHFGRGEMGRRGGFFMGGPKVFSAIASALGMTTQDLTSKLQAGQTLAQIAGDKAQAVKDAIVNTIKPNLDQAVKNGKMTTDQENSIISKIQSSDLSTFAGHWKWGGQKGDKKGPATNGSTSFFRQAPALGGAL